MTIDKDYEDIDWNGVQEIKFIRKNEPADLLALDEMQSSTNDEDFNRKKEQSLDQTITETEEHDTRQELLHRFGKKMGSASRLAQPIERITRVTQHMLNASASSVLLLDEQNQELIFEVAEGQVGKKLRRVRLNARSGIAGWVACYGKPLIVNDVNGDERFNRSVDEITGFVTRSIVCAPLVLQRKTLGVIEVMNKLDGNAFTEQDLDTLASVAHIAAISIENVKINKTILDAYKSTIEALAAAIDTKDPHNWGHSQRVTDYVLMGAASMPFSASELADIEYAGILHDIGKIGIPDNILAKPGALTAEEKKILRQHPVIGADILKGIPFLKEARRLVLRHHERHDGKGYPDGLKGEAIPMGARLLAVADAFDYMTTHHAHRTALNFDSAFKELYTYSGTQFCPVAVEAFISGFRLFHFPKNG